MNAKKSGNIKIEIQRNVQKNLNSDFVYITKSLSSESDRCSRAINRRLKILQFLNILLETRKCF